MDGKFYGNFDGNFDGNLMGILMMDSTGWPYDSFDCLLYTLKRSCRGLFSTCNRIHAKERMW